MSFNSLNIAGVALVVIAGRVYVRLFTPIEQYNIICAIIYLIKPVTTS